MKNKKKNVKNASTLHTVRLRKKKKTHPVVKLRFEKSVPYKKERRKKIDPPYTHKNVHVSKCISIGESERGNPLNMGPARPDL